MLHFKNGFSNADKTKLTLSDIAMPQTLPRKTSLFPVTWALVVPLLCLHSTQEENLDETFEGYFAPPWDRNCVAQTKT